MGGRMRNAGLAILYEPEAGRPLTVARISDRRLLVAAAEAAIREARDHASALQDADEILGAVQQEEAERIRRVLGLLVPEVDSQTPQKPKLIGQPTGSPAILEPA
jgi:hypothetical protein